MSTFSFRKALVARNLGTVRMGGSFDKLLAKAKALGTTRKDESRITQLDLNADGIADAKLDEFLEPTSGKVTRRELTETVKGATVTIGDENADGRIDHLARQGGKLGFIADDRDLDGHTDEQWNIAGRAAHFFRDNDSDGKADWREDQRAGTRADRFDAAPTVAGLPTLALGAVASSVLPANARKLAQTTTNASQVTLWDLDADGKADVTETAQLQNGQAYVSAFSVTEPSGANGAPGKTLTFNVGGDGKIESEDVDGGGAHVELHDINRDGKVDAELVNAADGSGSWKVDGESGPTGGKIDWVQTWSAIRSWRFVRPRAWKRSRTVTVTQRTGLLPGHDRLAVVWHLRSEARTAAGILRSSSARTRASSRSPLRARRSARAQPRPRRAGETDSRSRRTERGAHTRHRASRRAPAERARARSPAGRGPCPRARARANRTRHSPRAAARRSCPCAARAPACHRRPTRRAGSRACSIPRTGAERVQPVDSARARALIARMPEPRSHWRLDPSVVFLNHGSFGACPTEVLAYQARLRDQLEAEPVRFFVRELEPLLDQALASLAGFVGARWQDLAFVPNATAGVNAVLRSLSFSEGDELLVTDHGYNACRNAIDFVAQRAGARVVVSNVPFPLASSEVVVERLVAAVTPRTRLALVDHVTSPTGLVFPIERIVRELQARGVDVLVDGAHAPGMVPLELNALGAAYYTGNCHKWLCAPKGAAFLHVREDRQRAVRPLIISHGANATRTDRSRFRLEFDWPGTFDPTAALSIPECIRFLGALEPGGWPALRDHNRRMALASRDLLCRTLEIAPPAPDEMIGALASVPLPAAPPHTPGPFGFDPLQERLWQDHRIEVPLWSWPSPKVRLLRVSLQRYNALAEIETLCAALREALADEGRSLGSH